MAQLEVAIMARWRWVVGVRRCRPCLLTLSKFRALAVKRSRQGQAGGAPQLGSAPMSISPSSWVVTVCTVISLRLGPAEVVC